MNKAFTFVWDDDEARPRRRRAAASASPWEFSGYSHTVAEEHMQRKTTSIDHKISQARLKRKHKLRGKRKTTGAEEEEEEKEEEEEQEHKHQLEGSDDEEEAPREEEEEEEENGSDSASEDDRQDDHESDEFEGDEMSEGEDVQPAASRRDEKSKKNHPAVVQVSSRKDAKMPSSFFSSAEGAKFNSKSFMELNLSRPLLRACDALGYKQPTPIQAACIPLALTGRDICGSAVTGSGKTAAFALPLLERLLFRPRRIPAIRVLVLTPTRELAVQLHSMIEKLAQFTDIRICLVVGGLSSKVQEVGLRSHPDIVIATPGRMIDHLYNSQSVGLEDLAILVLDEADRLLELGFRNEVHELVRLCPKKRQTMLFSATMTEEVNELVKLSLLNPVRLSADPSTQRPATLLEQVVKIKPQHEGNKEAVLLALCSRTFTSKAIIFSGTKIEAHRLKILFGLFDLKAAELHGNLTQAQRLEALELFRKMEVDFLIATDVAARGLDIIGVATVINFECPSDITTYVHRVGRTARAGSEGCAITFASEKDRPLLKLIAKRAGSKLTNRIVPLSKIIKWHERIQEMENSVREILQAEMIERAMRKAEMEANKAQNLMEYESEIYSRPKRTWFQTTKEKRQIANAAKNLKSSSSHDATSQKVSSTEKDGNNEKRERISKQEKLTRKKRRRLEAGREAMDEGDAAANSQGMLSKKKSTKAELAYKKAKAVKALGKRWPSNKFHKDFKPKRVQTRSSEKKELFGVDFVRQNKNDHLHKKNSKRSFKSKRRYKRR